MRRTKFKWADRNPRTKCTRELRVWRFRKACQRRILATRFFNLITFSRPWIRPWAFCAIEDKSVRDALLVLFPDGCYVAFAGDTYCESRNETMDDCWRVMHALPGDGQNRPSVGDSLLQIQERYNTLSNIQA